MPRSCAAATLAVVTLLSTTSCSLFRSEGELVDKAGGAASSDDGRLRATFTSGQLPDDTRVTITQNVAGPDPVPGFVPLSQPFDISLDHNAGGGTVTAAYQLPAGITAHPGQLVMFIEEHGTWKLVPTTADPATRTITGTWPHFSKGHIALFNPILTVGDGAAWSWDKVKAGTGWVVDKTGDVAKGIAAGAVGLTGGTTDTVRCKTPAKEWTAVNSTGMTGCVEAKDKSGVWPAKVNDRYPYPLVVDLPVGTIGPGWRDLIDTHDPVELVLAMIASRSNRLAVPAGATVPFKLTADAPRTLRLDARLDAKIMAVKALGLIAAVLTRGASAAEVAAARAEIAVLEKELEDAFIAARQAGSKANTLGDYIQDTQADNSLVQMRKKALRKEQNSVTVNHIFNLLDLVACGTSAVTGAAQAGLSFTKQVGSLMNAMFDKCFPVFVKASITTQYQAELAKMNPTEQLKRIGDLTTGLLEQARDLRSTAAVSISGLIDTLSLGTINSSKARVTLNRPRPPSRLRNVDWVKAAGPRLNCGSNGAEQYFKTVYYDITGDEVPDSFVLLNCFVGAGRTSDHLMIYDGASDPTAPRLLGVRPENMPGRHFTGGCLQFDGRVVTMLSREYAPADPSSSPTRGVKVLAMWTGSRFDFSAATQFVNSPAKPVRGCSRTLQPVR